ncbi:MAG: hypothetical protein JWQ71_445 [Pedosphaera sp.]|nr:hypothetical protein [Pedosphaera sp.]
MNRTSRHFVNASLLACVALAITACGPAQSNTEKDASAEVRGEPINAPKLSPASVQVVAKKELAPSIEPKAVAPVEAKPVVANPATETKAPDKVVPPVIAQAKTGDLLTVGFDKLASYNFDIPDDAPLTNQTATVDKADEQIPANVKAFNQKKVSIKGFMLPLKVQDGSVTEFLIMKDQSMCCYGNVPKITEWVSVKTTGKGVKPIMDQAVSIQGTLHVGAMRENGYLVGIYQMDGDKLIESGD